jgi:LysM repeat protein
VVRARLAILTSALVVTSVVAACGDDAPAVQETLPPLNTTTSTTSTILVTTTVQKYYVIQRGDTLSKIADSFNVRLEDLMALNGIDNPDKIEAGQELEIPTGAVVLDSLPELDTTTSSSTG